MCQPEHVSTCTGHSSSSHSAAQRRTEGGGRGGGAHRRCGRRERVRTSHRVQVEGTHRLLCARVPHLASA
eukprot:1901745-Prymnesium_polylepis.1